MAMTLGVTLSFAERAGVRGLRGIWPERGSRDGISGEKSGALESREFRRDFRRGGMAEWSMAVVLKTTEPVRVPGDRIPLPPPPTLQRQNWCAFYLNAPWRQNLTGGKCPSQLSESTPDGDAQHVQSTDWSAADLSPTTMRATAGSRPLLA